MKKFLASLFSILIATLVGTGDVFARNSVENYQIESATFQLCEQATSLINAKNYQAAIEVLQRAATNDPTSYSGAVHLDLAICYEGLKQYDAAIREAKKAYSLDPKAYGALYEIANIYYRADRYDQAISSLRTYMQIVPDSGSKRTAQEFMKQIGSFGNLQKARKMVDQKRWNEAKNYLNSAATFDPTDYSASVHSLFAITESRLNHPQQALNEVQASLRYGAKDKEIIYLAGLLYADVARFDEAIKYVRQYTSMESDPAKLEEATKAITGFERDKAEQNSPNSKSADYFNELKSECFWEKERLPLKVYIRKSPNMLGYRSSFPDLVKVAFDTWCRECGKRIDYVLVNEPDKADITVKFITERIVADDDHGSTRPVGICYREYGSDGLEKCDINIRTVHPFNDNEPVDVSECASTLMHEVGHSLGLNHSKCMRDVMYYRSSPIQSGPPTKRDATTIARLYQSYPVVAFVPKASTTIATTTFLPLPTFMPPALPDASKIRPPMFMPPPLRAKLIPPMFTPPPLKEGGSKTALPPSFIPPPLKNGGSNGGSTQIKTTPGKPFFTPPPLK